MLWHQSEDPPLFFFFLFFLVGFSSFSLFPPAWLPTLPPHPPLLSPSLVPHHPSHLLFYSVHSLHSPWKVVTSSSCLVTDFFFLLTFFVVSSSSCIVKGPLRIHRRKKNHNWRQLNHSSHSTTEKWSLKPLKSLNHWKVVTQTTQVTQPLKSGHSNHSSCSTTEKWSLKPLKLLNHWKVVTQTTQVAQPLKSGTQVT